ncbi:MAG: hypothetical protein ACXVCP_00430 [Bdellovibrio sp.]
MTEVQKTALKEILHTIVDKEQKPVLKELIGKLPADYQGAALAIFEVAEAAAEKLEDAAIDKI